MSNQPISLYGVPGAAALDYLRPAAPFDSRRIVSPTSSQASSISNLVAPLKDARGPQKLTRQLEEIIGLGVLFKRPEKKSKYNPHVYGPGESNRSPLWPDARMNARFRTAKGDPIWIKGMRYANCSSSLGGACRPSSVCALQRSMAYSTRANMDRPDSCAVTN